MDDVRNDVAALLKTTSTTTATKPATTTTTKPTTTTTAATTFKLDDEVKLISGAKYTNGGTIPGFVFNSKLYVRGISGNNITISTLASGAVTGVVDKKYLTPYKTTSTSTTTTTAKPVATTTTTSSNNTFKVGDTVNLIAGATYSNGGTIPSFVFNNKLYVREIQGDNIVISTLASGAVTGVVNKKFLKSTNAATTAPAATTSTSSGEKAVTPYVVIVTADLLNVRKGPGTNYGVATTIKKNEAYTIIAEASGAGASKYGKLKSGAGWISLDYVKKK